MHVKSVWHEDEDNTSSEITAKKRFAKQHRTLKHVNKRLHGGGVCARVCACVCEKEKERKRERERERKREREKERERETAPGNLYLCGIISSNICYDHQECIRDRIEPTETEVERVLTHI
jgi:hypothetical protein